jgi:hypothetical protein
MLEAKRLILHLSSTERSIGVCINSNRTVQEFNIMGGLKNAIEAHP